MLTIESMAGMMDQLASVQIEFIPEVLDTLLQRNFDYYQSIGKTKRKHCKSSQPSFCCIKCGDAITKPRYWALKPIHTANDPVRPWGLHKIEAVKSCMYKLTGEKERTPGMYKKIDPSTGKATHAYLEDTNERIHSSVRFRLACQGLSVNDDTV
jgi:hypothetical protein